MDDELYLNAIGVDWDQVTPRSYLRDIPAIAALTRLELRAPVTFFAGENGSGKSTLIEAIAVAWGFNPEGGTRNYVFSTFDTHSELCGAIRLTRSVRRPAWGYFLRAESFYNVATNIDELDAGAGGRRIVDSYGGESLHAQSHGESFMALPGADVLQIDENGIERVDYRDTEHYLVTRKFLENPEQMLRYLFED